MMQNAGYSELAIILGLLCCGAAALAIVGALVWFLARKRKSADRQ
jgi:hypothetical protein